MNAAARLLLFNRALTAATLNLAPWVLAVNACGGGFVGSADDAAAPDVGRAPDEGADVPADAFAPPADADAADVRTLDGSAPDVHDSQADELAAALCCHIDCNGPADLPCDAAGVLCYDAGCMFYMSCGGNVEKCP